ncbi:ATP-binding protein [Streptomyces sp. RFCAC02]|uniref:ATP-binding protein n=1 Tax=Streptomyces sp. RFCAC02 TaxID=2499143 RepID=UPI00143D3C35|nr:ATP-binding protein [Streptomyces sp. RFCAC02]
MLVLPGVPASAGHLRQALAELAGSWDLPGQLISDAQIVGTELFANALEHGGVGGGPVPVEMMLGPGPGLLISVSDHMPDTPPAPQRADGDAEQGRGLALVTALSRDWGWERRPGRRRKHVFALLGG